MKWFHIKFSESDLSTLTDERLIKEFIRLTHQLHHPAGLALYELKFRVEDGKVVYISSPDDYAYKVKSLLGYFPSQEVSRPNSNVLNLVLGKAIA
jgi:hypothetical protein